MAAQILKGKTPAQVLQIVPLLFSVCGKAQSAAASAALQVAQQGNAAITAMIERAIVCEVVQENLWRLMLDWPKLLGVPQKQEQRFAGWYALLRKIAAGEVDMDAFLQEFERDGLGIKVTELRAIDGYPALQTWWNQVHSPIAQLMSSLDELERGRHKPSAIRLLPAWKAAEAEQACSARWDNVFSAKPDWLGEPAETGAWSYFAEDSLLQEVWQHSGSKALTRLLARVLDVVEMASGSARPRLDVASSATSEGVAVVRTARGLLMHHVRLTAEKVTDYVIVAPTEWNFHPDGAFAQDMRGLKASNEEDLQHLAHIAALSLDPCVAYEIEVRHHG
jgi:hypothetical protein